MGVDLTLIPVQSETVGQLYAPTLLEFGRYYDLFEQIEAMPSTESTSTLRSFRGRDESGETCYGDTKQTPYGDPIKFVRAGDLARLTFDPSTVMQETSAAMAYVRALKPDTLVGLYWH